MREPDLRALQEWMAVVVRHPEDAEAACRTEEARRRIPRAAVLRGDVVLPSSTMDPLARLDVYNGGYLSRLVEVLESDFPGVRHALGEEGFAELVRAYVTRHPSRHPNLNRLGRHLAEFVAGREGLARREFLADLARLEWAMQRAFDAPRADPLDLNALAGLSDEQWAEVVFEPSPSLQVLAFDHPVNAYLQAVLDEREPELPDPRPSFVAVYRKDWRVWRLGLPEPMYRILDALARGVPFAAALARGGEHDEDVSSWFREWSADGLLAGARIA